MSVPDGLAMPGAKGFPTIESILGPQLIGTLLSTALWGVIFVQTYDYFNTPNQDHLLQKLAVTFLWILGTLDSVMVTHAIYFYLVKNFANPSSLLITIWTVSCRALINAIISFVVRSMFARRIYLVSRKNIPLTLWIMGISTADLVVGILVTAKSLLGLNSERLPSLRTVLVLSFSLGLASDISVTIALFWLLHSVKTGVPKTDSIVKTLILYVVTTGLLVVIDISLGIIFYIVMPDNLAFFVFYLLFGKLYISAYLASLNGREQLRNNQTDVGISLSRMSYQNRPATLTLDDNKPSFHRSDNTTAITLESSTEPRTDDQEFNNTKFPSVNGETC